MAVDLSDLIDSLKREVTPPGGEDTTFPAATDTTWLGYLKDGFWEARMDGLLPRWEADEDGIVEPFQSTDGDIPRELQQVIVFYAGYRIVRNALRTQQTRFSVTAGPVSYETSYSASTLKDLLAALTEQRNLILTRLSDLGIVPSVYIDGVLARTSSILAGDTYWVGA